MPFLANRPLASLSLANAAFLLASEAFLLEAEAFLLASEAFLLEAEAFLLASEAFLLEAEAFLLESETFLLEVEAFLLEAEDFLLEPEDFLLEPEALFLEAENKATFFVFGAEDILIGTFFPFTRMNGFSGLDLNAETLPAEFLFEGLFFFASSLFGVFSLKETFLFLLIGEEEDFLDFLFLLETEALLTSSSRSFLISRCILLDFDLTMF